MFKKHTKCLLIILLAAFFPFISQAQPKDNSPFTQFGIGDLSDTSLPSSHGMGGLGAVYHDFFEANLDNPASLGFLQYTTFQIGFFAKRSGYTRINDKQTVWNGNLDHISLNIPLINPLNEALERRETDFSWGTSFSIRPYSQIGYHIRLQDSIAPIGRIQRDFKGTGGIYQVNWGNGWKYKNLSAGLNLTYMYGKEAKDELISFEDLENPYRDIFTSTHAYKGFQYRFGLQYEQPLDLKKARANNDNPSRLLSAGLFFGGQTTLTTKSDITKLGFNSVTHDVDTAFISLDAPGEAVLPGTWGFGLMYRHAGKFRVGVDYEGAAWSDYRNVNQTPAETLKDSKRFAAGVAWIPDANSITSYFKRVEYRAGFYALQDPRVIEGEQVKEFAVTVGGAFPLIVQRNIAWFQLGLDFGKRTGGDRLSDNFMRGKVAIVFNDNAWFIRSKYH